MVVIDGELHTNSALISKQNSGSNEKENPKLINLFNQSFETDEPAWRREGDVIRLAN